MTILHVFPGIIGGVLGSWTRFKGIIEKSNSHHVILSSPATEDITHTKQEIKKHGINYKIKLIYGYKYLKNRGEQVDTRRNTSLYHILLFLKRQLYN